MIRYANALLVAAFSAAWPPSLAAQPPPEPIRLTLDEAVARGLASSHRIDEGTARADAASAGVEERHAASLPKLNAQGGYARTNHVDEFGILLPNNQLRIIYPDVPDNYRTRIDAQWPIYTGGRVEALERAARTDASAFGHDVDATRADLKAEISRAYWALASASESVLVLDRSIVQVDAHLRDARNRLDAGLVAPHEVLSAEAQQARHQMLRIQAAGNRELAEAVLGRLIGANPGTPLLPTSPFDLSPPATDRYEDLLLVARDRRSDRRSLGDRLAAAAERTKAAAAGHRPTVGIGGGLDYSRPNQRIFPRQASWKDSWDASVNIDWPLFDGGRAKAELAEASAAGRAAEARLAEFDSLLALEIRQRMSELVSNRAAIAAADVAIRAAKEAHRVIGERFNAGVATSTDVLDAQIILLQSELDRTHAVSALRAAEAGLARATGR